MTDKSNARNSNGQFTAGNQGGPGRPPRSVESDYLRKLTQTVPLETWQRIIDRAVTAALDGDDKARAWLSKYLLGERLPTLAKLHAREIEGFDEIEDAHDYGWKAGRDFRLARESEALEKEEKRKARIAKLATPATV